MNILFDMLTTCRKTGAGEYVRKVFYELLHYIRQEKKEVSITCIYNSDKGIAYDDLSIPQLQKHGVEVIDIYHRNICTITDELKIDNIFIGCAQYWHNVEGLQDVKCSGICVIHDLSHQEKTTNHIDEYTKLGKPLPALVWSICRLRRKHNDNALIEPVISLVKNNKRFRMVTVSEYTKTTILYHFDLSPKQIEVLHSPSRVFHSKSTAEHSDQPSWINASAPFFLMVGCKHRLKNAEKAIQAFQKFVQTPEGKDYKLVTIGYPQKRYDFQIPIPFLSDRELELAYSNCHAFIYPSLFEGFGYPPVEAMKYGKPILCSNVCSMPEILGDAPIYFSPLYEADIYYALCKLTKKGTYEEKTRQSVAQYSVISTRQHKDTHKLILQLLSIHEE